MVYGATSPILVTLNKKCAVCGDNKFLCYPNTCEKKINKYIKPYIIPLIGTVIAIITNYTIIIFMTLYVSQYISSYLVEALLNYYYVPYYVADFPDGSIRDVCSIDCASYRPEVDLNTLLCGGCGKNQFILTKDKKYPRWRAYNPNTRKYEYVCNQSCYIYINNLEFK